MSAHSKVEKGRNKTPRMHGKWNKWKVAYDISICNVPFNLEYHDLYSRDDFKGPYLFKSV